MVNCATEPDKIPKSFLYIFYSFFFNILKINFVNFILVKSFIFKFKYREWYYEQRSIFFMIFIKK